MKQILLVALAFLGIFGCKPEVIEPQTNEVHPGKYFPVNVGYWWKYDKFILQESGQSTFSNVQLRRIDSLQGTYFRINHTVDNNLVAYTLVKGSGDGLTTSYINDSDTLKTYVLSTEKSDSSRTVTRRIYSGLRNVNTPFGKVKAILLELESRKETPNDTFVLTKFNYYAENIGTVVEEETTISWSASHRNFNKKKYVIKEYYLNK